MDECVEHRDFPLVANDQAAEIGNPSDGSLDFPAAFVSSQLSSILPFRLRTVDPVGTNQVNATFLQSVPKRIRIRCLFVDQAFLILSGAAATAPRYRDRVQ